MADDLDLEALQEVSYRLTEVQVMVGCPNCGWVGVVQLYDIGDGPEWCCPGCDQCFPSKPVVGEDGKTNAERQMFEAARQHQQQKWGNTDGSDAETGSPGIQGRFPTAPG